MDVMTETMCLEMGALLLALLKLVSPVILQSNPQSALKTAMEQIEAFWSVTLQMFAVLVALLMQALLTLASEDVKKFVELV